MRIDIQANGLILTSGLRQHIKQRLLTSFQRTQQHFRKISVRLLDINGPRGGLDKRCRLHIGLVGGQDLVIESTDTQLHNAIEGAAHRAESNLFKRLGKRTHKRRQKYDLPLLPI
jgi:hypothetical protein